MNITITDIIIGILTWHLVGAVISLLLGYAQYFIGSHLKKIQIKGMAKDSPEIKRTTKKGK